MTKRNLVTALAAALHTNPDPGIPPAAAPDRGPLPVGDALLDALRNSATGHDQIMQRRLGLLLNESVS